jgi:hypothetical protein
MLTRACLLALIPEPLPRAHVPRVHEFATLADHDVRRLQNWPALYRVAPDGEPDDCRSECRGEGASLRAPWVEPGQEGAAAEGSGVLVVGPRLRRVEHPAIVGKDGSGLPALVEHRLTRAVAVGAKSPEMKPCGSSGPRSSHIARANSCRARKRTARGTLAASRRWRPRAHSLGRYRRTSTKAWSARPTQAR